jgi:hypothetical protein
MGKGRGNWEIKHGGARRCGRDPEYYVWWSMKRRCSDPSTHSYKDYGGRGITVCERWSDYGAFIADMGPRPTPAHTIERVNNDAGYSPENCAWATRTEQALNRRPRQRMEACRAGHPLDEKNTYARPDGKRGCKECRRNNMRDFYERKKQRAAS